MDSLLKERKRKNLFKSKVVVSNPNVVRIFSLSICALISITWATIKRPVARSMIEQTRPIRFYG